MPRLGEVARLGVLVAEQADGGGAVEGADARGHTVADRLDGHGERGAETRRVLVDHGANAELVEPPPLAGNADQPAPVRRHEVDRLRGDAVGGDREIALVLAILVVDDDHELAGADVGDGVLDAGQPHLLLPVPGCGERRAELPRRQRAGDVACDEIDLKVHAGPDRPAAGRGVAERQRNQRDGEGRLEHIDDSQTDAVDGDAALLGDEFVSPSVAAIVTHRALPSSRSALTMPVASMCPVSM